MSVIKTFMRKAFMNGARYSGLSGLLDPVLGGVGAILMLHHVHPRSDEVLLNRELHVDLAFLADLIEALQERGARFVSMDEVADRLKAGHTDERFLAVSLDDGYRDNLRHAAPVFRQFGVPYAIHIAPGLTDGTSDLWWELLQIIIENNDTLTYGSPSGPVTLDCVTPAQKYKAFGHLVEYGSRVIEEDAMRELVQSLCVTYGIDADGHRREALLNWEELRGLAEDPLATIGAHTMNHYHLRRLVRDRAADEIARAADVIGDKLGERPRHMAYPYGNAVSVGPREVELAGEAGFTTAVTTRHGVLRPAHGDNLLALPRISVNGYYQRLRYVETMLSGITVPAANCGRTFVTV